MKQGKLIRRAVSAALTGCMMFTLSAPALAESTDALMQLNIAATVRSVCWMRKTATASQLMA